MPLIITHLEADDYPKSAEVSRMFGDGVCIVCSVCGAVEKNCRCFGDLRISFPCSTVLRRKRDQARVCKHSNHVQELQNGVPHP